MNSQLMKQKLAKHSTRMSVTLLDRLYSKKVRNVQIYHPNITVCLDEVSRSSLTGQDDCRLKTGLPNVGDGSCPNSRGLVGI